MEENKLSVLLIEPGKTPKMIKIDDSLEAMQALVRGPIEVFSPFDNDVVIICNEEGKISGLPLNRAIYADPEPIEISYSEMKNLFRTTERDSKEHKKGYIVFTKDSFDAPYSEPSRTYVVSSNNKAFLPGMGGYSIFGSSLDGTDMHVRLDLYMADERGEKDGWKIERCYIKKEPPDMVEIIAGTFFLVSAPAGAENFESLSQPLAEKYAAKFHSPEHFFKANGKIVAKPYEPKTESRER